MVTARAAATSHMDADALTIVRFAHAFATGGGVETYLDDLDRALLAERPWTIIRMHLSDGCPGLPAESAARGKGRLVRIPLQAVRRPPGPAGPPGPVRTGLGLRRRARAVAGEAALLLRPPFRHLLRACSARRRELEAVGAAAALRRVLAAHPVDLVVMHYIGGRDSARVIDTALAKGIPYVVVNHFANDRLNHFAFREQAWDAAGIGGVSADHVPARERRRFTHLADGIDLRFYRPAPSAAGAGRYPLIFMPARLTPAKGQHDLVQALAELRDRGVPAELAFAGRADEEAYLAALRRRVADAGLESRVTFLGELGPDALRAVYARTAVVAFPTYHHEGVPRVLLEAQAMQVPVVAYGTGGIAATVVPSEAGCLVATGDLPSLVARLHEVLADPARRRRMGAAGRAHVERNFGLEALAARHETFYRRALRPAGAARPRS
jgi:glycosyltransferase involved in cell wall biosynthesis